MWLLADCTQPRMVASKQGTKRTWLPLSPWRGAGGWPARGEQAGRWLTERVVAIGRGRRPIVRCAYKVLARSYLLQAERGLAGLASWLAQPRADTPRTS